MEITDAATQLRDAVTNDDLGALRSFIKNTSPSVWEALSSLVDAVDSVEEAEFEAKRAEQEAWRDAIRSPALLVETAHGTRLMSFHDAIDFIIDESAELPSMNIPEERLDGSWTIDLDTGRVTAPGEKWAIPTSRGRYIAIEGIDGSGKTTQARMLAASLGATLVREPGTTTVGEAIRSILKDPMIEMSVMTEVYLFAAARAQLVAEIKRYLDLGRDVVTDRSVFSSLVYQSREELTPQMIADINEAALGDVLPDLVVLLTIDPNVAASRNGAPDAMEKRVEMARIAKGYMRASTGSELAVFDPLSEVPWIVVYTDESMDEEDVANAVLNAVESFFD